MDKIEQNNNREQFALLGIEKGDAICYSGYRTGQSPDFQIYPTYDQIKEDLLILQHKWKYIRLYDCSQHAKTVLKVIQQEKLDLKVMLGAYIAAELNNFNCPWGGVYSKEVLEENRVNNKMEVERLIELANEYPDIVFSLAVGNEATVDWTDHFVPVEKIIEYVKAVKEKCSQPITFCENYVPWLTKLKPLVEVLDFISIHTYPVWEYKNIHEALDYTRQNYQAVKDKFPDKMVVITEAGWATNSNGRGIDPQNVSEDYQEIYLNDLNNWVREESILCFVFEAFDEPWKGSPEILEPEKHWGLFKVDRTPKKVMKDYLKSIEKK